MREEDFKKNFNICDEMMGDSYESKEYEVFPGISIAYYNSHTQEACFERQNEDSDVLEIFHCREGRMECSVEEEFCYISPGDLLITKSGAMTGLLYFPLRHYHGITIRIDTKKTPKCLSCFLRDVAVQPKIIEEKFCKECKYFIARSNTSVEHIFSELYAVPKEIRQGYSKIKVLELMLFLSVFDIEKYKSSNATVSVHQVSLAKSIVEFLNKKMGEKITLQQLSQKFGVSATVIKNSFKAVYGVSFYSYIKTQKMESAAYMLEYTDKTVLEIANDHGYDNSSKFAVAFRSVKNMSPNEYRAKNSYLATY